MNSLPGLRSHCPACGAELSLHERHAGGFCLDWQCRRRRVEAQRNAEFEQQMLAERDAASWRGNLPDGRPAPMVFVRLYQTGLEAVAAAQREALRAHLMALQPAVEALAAAAAAVAAEAGAGAEAEAEAETAAPTFEASQDNGAAQEVDALLAQVCARCTGHCCRLGFGRHAFLDAAAVFRVTRASPQLGHAELVEAYIDAIPDLHHAESCAFHGEQGCVLPRQRRADICNDFECPGLEKTRQHAEAEGVRRVWVVRHNYREQADGGFAPPLLGPGIDPD